MGNKLDAVQGIISKAGGESYRRPYDEDDMQVLRGKIHDVVSAWGKAGRTDKGWDSGDLSQLDVKRMVMSALVLLMFDINSEGDTDEDLNGFAREVVAELEDTIALFRQQIPKTPTR